MFGVRGGRSWAGTLPLSLLFVALSGPDADAQWRGRSGRRAPAPAYPAARVAPAPSRSLAPLGTFYPTPYISPGASAPAGGGYSPLGSFGDTTMSLYGPFSAFRFTSAPIVTYTRGYNGRGVLAPGTSFSTPNLPAL